PPVQDSATATVRCRARQTSWSRRAAAVSEADEGADSSESSSAFFALMARYVCPVFWGGLGGANSHVSGIPSLPSAPSDTPLTVKWVTPDEPVRTSREFCAVNVSVFPLEKVLPACPVLGSTWPSVQAL